MDGWRKMIGLIPVRFKIYGIIAVGIVLGLLGWRNAGIKAALEKAEAREKEVMADSIRISRKVQNDIEKLDNHSLRGRASKWVRNHSDSQ